MATGQLTTPTLTWSTLKERPCLQRPCLHAFMQCHDHDGCFRQCLSLAASSYGSMAPMAWQPWHGTHGMGGHLLPQPASAAAAALCACWACTACMRMQAALGSLDGIINTISAHHDLQPLLSLLRVDGRMVCVGAPEEPPKVRWGEVHLAWRMDPVYGNCLRGGIRTPPC